MCWATSWAIFFTNSSGHPAGKRKLSSILEGKVEKTGFRKNVQFKKFFPLIQTGFVFFKKIVVRVFRFYLQGSAKSILKPASVTRLGENSPFGRYFLALGAFFSEKYRLNGFGAISLKNRPKFNLNEL
jgi:hypothetical protein